MITPEQRREKHPELYAMPREELLARCKFSPIARRVYHERFKAGHPISFAASDRPRIGILSLRRD